MNAVVERFLHRALIAIALIGLAVGAIAWASGDHGFAQWAWAAGSIPVALGLFVSIVRDLLAGRAGVDVIALLSMTGALLLEENLAAIVVAVMYAGGTMLEDFAVSRAERDLKALVDRAPRVAHRTNLGEVTDVPVSEIAVGDTLLVRAGEVVPVDGVLLDPDAILDEAALSGEPIPVARRRGEAIRSGAINAGQTFTMEATATETESTYAGIVRMATAAQTAKSPAIRLADRFALLLLPVAIGLAGVAWAIAGDPVRALAVLVAATPCPLILAAPVAYIAGVARAARLGVLMKGGAALEALAQTRTVIFDKTGTLTVGGARLIEIETAPGWSAEEALRLAASVEQASQHVVAAAIVAAARERHLPTGAASDVREAMGSGVAGVVEGRRVRAGSHAFVFDSPPNSPWSRRTLRRASLHSALTVFVSVDGRSSGRDPACRRMLREAPRAIQGLRAAGVSRIVMVTGDRTIPPRRSLPRSISTRFSPSAVPPIRSMLSPSSKNSIPPIMVEERRINDAPALAAAGVGVAMGARGATASSEAADVVILVDRLDRVSDAVGIARARAASPYRASLPAWTLSGMAMIAAALGQPR